MARETFTDTDGVELPTHSADWVYNTGYLGTSRAIINSNALAAGSAGAGSLTRYVGASFGDDQYAEGIMVAVTTLGAVGPAVRMSTAGACSAYVMICYSDRSQTFKLVAGVATQLGSNTAALGVGEKATIEIEGNVLTTKKDATVLYSGTDSALSTGAPGIYSEQSSVAARLDDWDCNQIYRTKIIALLRDRRLTDTPGEIEFSIEWTLTVRGEANGTVTLTQDASAATDAELTDSLRTQLAAYVSTATGQSFVAADVRGLSYG
jgi:hypothetical protein